MMDIIVVTEIWTFNSETDFFLVSNFNLLTNCNVTARSKGVAFIYERIL